MNSWAAAEKFTIPQFLWNVASERPSQVFLDFEGSTFTYEEVTVEVARLANTLQYLGVRKGDTVLTMLDNQPDAVFLWIAANCLGAISVAINTALKGDFLAHMVNDSTSSIFIGQPEYVQRLSDIRNDIPLVKTVVTTGPDIDAVDKLAGFALDAVRLDTRSFSLANVHPSDLTSLVYTGGTTGPSKACMISHAYLMSAGIQVNRIMARQPEEIVWNSLPNYHINLPVTTVASSMIVGGRAAISRRFSVSGFWPEVLRSKARVVCLLGSMITMIAQMPDTKEMLAAKGQVRALHGAPFSADDARIWKNRFGLQVAGVNGYGTTEAFLLTEVPGGVGAKPGTSGRRTGDFDVRIFDDDDQELGVAEAGEIVYRPMRAHRMFDGYWRRPEDTLRQMRNMWFHTGDIGMFDEDGFLHFLDRKKDYLRVRGENVSSSEVEIGYMKHPDIKQVAVHAVFSPFGEDDLKVTAVLRDGSELTPEALFEWAIPRFPYFALPRYIEFRSDLPKTEFGRVLKLQLRSEGCTTDTWDREVAGVVFERR
jgi:crotonobetaine/carnitine-CoA ligase